MASTNNGGSDSLVTVGTRSNEMSDRHGGLYLVASLGIVVLVGAYFACIDRARATVELRVERGDRASIRTERTLRMWLTAVSSFGIGYTWAIQQSRLTGLLKALGFSSRELMAAFAPGPIIGIFVQPIIAVISDNLQSPFGKRRPLIAGGGLVLVVAYTILANAYTIGSALGDNEGEGGGGPRLRLWGAIFAVSFFWIADFAINAALLPVRVLASTTVAHEHQDEIMSKFSVTDNGGKILAFLLGSFSLASPEFTASGDTSLVADVRAQFLVSCVCILVAFGTTCTFVREKDSRPLHKQERRFDTGGPNHSRLLLLTHPSSLSLDSDYDADEDVRGLGDNPSSGAVHRDSAVGGGGSGGGGKAEERLVLKGGRRGGVRFRPASPTSPVPGEDNDGGGGEDDNAFAEGPSARGGEAEEREVESGGVGCGGGGGQPFFAFPTGCGSVGRGKGEPRTRDEFLHLYGPQTGTRLWGLAKPAPFAAQPLPPPTTSLIERGSAPGPDQDAEAGGGGGGTARTPPPKPAAAAVERRHKLGRWSIDGAARREAKAKAQAAEAAAEADAAGATGAGSANPATNEESGARQKSPKSSSGNKSLLGQVAGAFSETRDVYVATVVAKDGSSMAPLRDTARVEFCAWFFWAVLALWGPLVFSVEIYQGDPMAVVCTYPIVPSSAPTTVSSSFAFSPGVPALGDPDELPHKKTKTPASATEGAEEGEGEKKKRSTSGFLIPGENGDSVTFVPAPASSWSNFTSSALQNSTSACWCCWCHDFIDKLLNSSEAIRLNLTASTLLPQLLSPNSSEMATPSPTPLPESNTHSPTLADTPDSIKADPAENGTEKTAHVVGASVSVNSTGPTSNASSLPEQLFNTSHDILMPLVNANEAADSDESAVQENSTLLDPVSRPAQNWTEESVGGVHFNSSGVANEAQKGSESVLQLHFNSSGLANETQKGPESAIQLHGNSSDFADQSRNRTESVIQMNSNSSELALEPAANFTRFQTEASPNSNSTNNSAFGLSVNRSSTQSSRKLSDEFGAEAERNPLESERDGSSSSSFGHVRHHHRHAGRGRTGDNGGDGKDDDDSDDEWHPPPLPVAPAFAASSPGDGDSSHHSSGSGGGGSGEKEGSEDYLTTNGWPASAALAGVEVCVEDFARRKAFDDGLHLFSFANLGGTSFSLLFSPVVPRLLRYYGNRTVWSFSLLAMGIISFVLSLLPWIWLPWPEPNIGEAGLLGSPKGMLCAFLIALSGIPWALRMTIPYALVGKNYPSGGIHLSVVNSHFCVTQLIAACISPVLVSSSGRASSVFFPAAICGLAAARLAFTMDEGAAAHHSSEYEWVPGVAGGGGAGGGGGGGGCSGGCSAEENESRVAESPTTKKATSGSIAMGTPGRNCSTIPEAVGSSSVRSSDHKARAPSEKAPISAASSTPSTTDGRQDNNDWGLETDSEGGYMAPSASQVMQGYSRASETATTSWNHRGSMK